jgi:hypothetical protein
MILRTISVRAGKICCLAIGQHTVSFDDFTLCFRYIVDPACVDLVACTEQGFPSCHGVGADDGAIFVSEISTKWEEKAVFLLRGSEIDAFVLWRATVLF